MQTFNQITNKLKQIIGSGKDKDVAAALGIKPTTFASMKRQNKIPHKAIINYCHDNYIDANTICQCFSWRRVVLPYGRLMTTGF